MCHCGFKKQLAVCVKQHIQHCGDHQLPFTQWNTPCIINAFIRHILGLLRWQYGQSALDTLLTIKNHVAIQYPGRMFCQLFFEDAGGTVRNAPLEQKRFQFIATNLQSCFTTYSCNFQNI
jgi:hypothetical protein